MEKWCHCNSCTLKVIKAAGIKFCLTTCMHILCSKCIKKANKPLCLVCGKKYSSPPLIIDSSLPKDVSVYLESPESIEQAARSNYQQQSDKILKDCFKVFRDMFQQQLAIANKHFKKRLSIASQVRLFQDKQKMMLMKNTIKREVGTSVKTQLEKGARAEKLLQGSKKSIELLRVKKRTLEQFIIKNQGRLNLDRNHAVMGAISPISSPHRSPHSGGSPRTLHHHGQGDFISGSSVHRSPVSVPCSPIQKRRRVTPPSPLAMEQTPQQRRSSPHTPVLQQQYSSKDYASSNSSPLDDLSNRLSLRESPRNGSASPSLQQRQMEVHNSSQGRAMSNSSTRLPSLSRRPSPQLPKLSSHQNGENRGVSQSTPVTPSFNKKNYPTMMSRTSLTPTANFYNNGATTQQWRSPGAPGFSSTPTNPVTGNRPKPNIPASPSLEASTLIDRLHKRDQVHFIKP